MNARTRIAERPNLGPKSESILAAIGVTSPDQLRRLGAVAAYAMARRSGAKVSLNLLWALEGALTGRPWQQVAREDRTSLLLALDQREHGTPDPRPTGPRGPRSRSTHPTQARRP